MSFKAINFDDEFASIDDHATALRKCGLQVVPSFHPLDAPKAWKRPSVNWKEHQDKPVDDETFAHWFPNTGGRKNIGILTGDCSGGVFCVDLDFYKGPEAGLWWGEMLDRQQHAGEIEETVTQITGGGGRQIFFRAPDGWTPPTRKSPVYNVDIRGRGGFVVCAPSMHSSGRRYEWAEGLAPWETEIALAPKWFCDQLDELFGAAGIDPATGTHTGPRIKTATPDAPVAPFGGITDGREEKMRDMVWARVIQMHIENPIGPPPPAEVQLEIDDLFRLYVNAVNTRRPHRPGVSKEQLLEEEGRGRSLMVEKFNDALRKWDTKVAQEAAKLRDRQSNNPAPGDGVKEEDEISSNDLADPVDFWSVFPPPALPNGLLPPAIESYARVQSESMGSDPAGVAMAAIAVIAAAIPDRVQLQVKEHDTHWCESARLWVALVGDPSTKKSPIMGQAVAPLRALDLIQFHKHKEAIKEWEALPQEEKKCVSRPTEERLIIEDATMEAAQELLKDSPDGVLCYQDELSGFFGAMDKYAGTRGAAKDRGFWLQSYNGGEYRVNRITRGSVFIPNLGVSMLGGIQPEPIRSLASDTVDDGLLQRLLPIILRAATVGQDQPKPAVAADYADLIELLREVQTPLSWFGEPVPVRFSPEAQLIRRQAEVRHLKLMQLEFINKKLASHIGKYDGIFARLCLIWHCIEHAHEDRLPRFIEASVAIQVFDFLHKFLFGHALAFYGGILHLSDDHDQLVSVAGYILAHRCSTISGRDLQRSVQSMKNMDRRNREQICQQLEALGWLMEKAKDRGPREWHVNPRVHELFRERAEQEKRRREDARQILAELPKR